MSQEERDWLDWLKRARDGKMTQREAAERMGVTERWVRKLLRRMKKQGDARGGAWAAGTGLQPQAARENTEAGAGDPAEAGLARFRADLCRRTTGQTSSDSSREGNAARVDDRSRHVAAGFAQDPGRAWLATTAQRVRRIGAVGHFRSRLAGRSRAGALSGADDRRRHQLELGPFCGDAMRRRSTWPCCGNTSRRTGGWWMSTRIAIRCSRCRGGKEKANRSGKPRIA